VLGLALVLFAVVIVWTALVSKVVGYLLGVSGLAYVMQGWVVGAEGFSRNNTAPTLTGIAAFVVASIWFLISAWRTKPRASVRA
jgi:hypothetical protein